MKKPEMHANSREQTRQITTLIRRSPPNLGLILRFWIRDALDQLSDNPSKPRTLHLSLKPLLESVTPSRRASLRRFIAQHSPPSEGGTKTIRFWSHPGQGAKDEIGADDRESLVPTQEFARLLIVFVLVQHGEEVPARRLREAIGIPESSWGNIITSLLPEEGVGDWPAMLLWRRQTKKASKTKKVGETAVRVPTHLRAPGDALARLHAVFGDVLWMFIDQRAIAEQYTFVDIFNW